MSKVNKDMTGEWIIRDYRNDVRVVKMTTGVKSWMI
jgi:hypothetical protein